MLLLSLLWTAPLLRLPSIHFPADFDYVFSGAPAPPQLSLRALLDLRRAQEYDPSLDATLYGRVDVSSSRVKTGRVMTYYALGREARDFLSDSGKRLETLREVVLRSVDLVRWLIGIEVISF